MVTFTATSKAAEAPDIEPGLYDARFDSIDFKHVEGGQFADKGPTIEVEQGGKKVVMNRFVWLFTLLDSDGAVLYDDGDPVEVDGLTSLSTNIASKTTPRAVRYLKALLTPEEYSQFEAGKGFDAEKIVGRVVQVEVAVNDNGWPTIANVLPPRQARKSKAKITPTPAASDVDEE